MNISKELVKKYGNVFIDGAGVIDKKREIISVSPKIDVAIGGGICSGSIVTLAGRPKCGKSLTAMCIARNAQRMGYHVFYVDIENRLKARDLEGINGLVAKDVEVIRSIKGKILNGEDHLSIIESIINDVPRSCIIADSISQLCLEVEYTSNLEDRNRSPGSLLLSKFFKRNNGPIAVNDSVLICIQHMVANLSGTHGPMFVKSGGAKLTYAADLGLACKSVKYDRGNSKEGVNQKSIGQTVEWFVECSSLAAPGNTVESYIRYGTGICEVTENISLGIDFGLIEAAGAGWLTLKYLGDEPKKIQGQEKLFNYFSGEDGKEDYKKLRVAIGKILS
jgi:RecA/RadA recombinase